jgi:hypothetical protein
VRIAGRYTRPRIFKIRDTKKNKKMNKKQRKKQLKSENIRRAPFKETALLQSEIAACDKRARNR